MTINREHLAGLELALNELSLSRESDLKLRFLIADAQAAPEAEPVAWIAADKVNALQQGWSATCYGKPWAEHHLKDGGFVALYAAADHIPDCPQHDAELIELLERVVDRLRKAQIFDLSTQVRAKLATLSAKP